MAEQDNDKTANFGISHRVKSPMYPYITFPDALSKAKLIYKYERRAATTANILYQHLGFQKKTGSSSRVVAALKQYGLLEEKSGQYKISDKAYRLFNLPDDSPEKLQIEKELAMRPRIFKEILANYSDGLPSDATLKSYLVLDKGFNENGADIFLRVFKAALLVAKPFENDYNDSDESFNEDDNEDEFEGEETMDGIGNTSKAASGSGSKLPPPLIDGTRVTIDIPPEGEIKISFTGDVNMKTFQFVNGILELQKKMFPESTNTQETASDIEQ